MYDKIIDIYNLGGITQIIKTNENLSALLDNDTINIQK